MIELQILYLVSFIANIFIAFFIIAINSKNILNRVYSLFAAMAGFWSLGLFIGNISFTYQGGKFGSVIAISSANFLSAFLLLFFLLFTENKINKNRKIIYLLIFIPAVVFSVLNLTTNLISLGLEKVPWGYHSIEGILYYPMTFFIFFYSVIGIFLCYRYYIKTKNQSQKIQSRNIIIAITIPLVLGFITEIFLPFNNINVPPLTIIFSTVSAIIIGYTIVKHRLMSPNIFSIKTKLTTAIMIIIILFGFVGAISVYQSKQVLTEIIGKNASISVVESMDKIEIATLDRIEEWQHFTEDETLKNKLLLSNENFSNIGTDKDILSHIQEIDNIWMNTTNNDDFHFLLELINNNLSKKLFDKISFYNSKYNFSLFGEVFLTNKYGAVIALTDKTTDYYQADESWWQVAKDNGLFIDEVSYDESANIYSLDLIIRIDDEEDQFLGILKVVWNIKEIEQIINESLFKNDINQDDIIFILLDGHGRVVYSTDDFNFLEKNLELFANIEYNSKINKRYFLIDSENYTNTLISFAFSDGYKKLDRLDLILIYEFNENAIFVPYFTLRNNIYLITVLISIITLIIGLFISHYFTKPILKLKEYTENISKGKYDIDIKMKESKDEIGSLALSFKDMTQKIKSYNNELKNLINQKNELVNQLGHDLKNPLNPLINLIPLLEKTETDSNKKEMLKVVNRNVGYMKNLVTNILELARLNSSATKFKIEETNISQELNKVINSNELILNEKKIKIVNNVPNNIRVSADRLRIEELFNNLLNNSIKYSDNSGSIVIDAKSDDDLVTISVKDFGIGMTEEQMSHVFDEFYKADSSRHDFDSSGLGMTICKRIVERHGGDIWVESEGRGKGTTFYFTLPKKELLDKKQVYAEDISRKNVSYQDISDSVDKVLENNIINKI